jgi:3-oxoacyl-[acyl-carrier-protein] synthase-3
MLRATLSGISYYLPAATLTNNELASLYPDWTADRIEAKTGIRSRSVAAEDETAADLAVRAAERLFAAGKADPREIDFVLFCTQTPDYLLPTSACLIQHRLGVPISAGALDFNLGCSGYVYGLALAKGLIETRAARAVLLLTADTYTKFIHPMDRSTRTLFGDAGTATMVRASERRDAQREPIGPFAFGTDGAGGDHFIIPASGLRARCRPCGTGGADSRGPEYLSMNGPAIFTFALSRIPEAVAQLLKAAGQGMEDVDLFVFHQANRFMLDALRNQLKIPQDKFIVDLADRGNTVSCTIPLALTAAARQGRNVGGTVMIVGFGVGLSWAAALLDAPEV